MGALLVAELRLEGMWASEVGAPGPGAPALSLWHSGLIAAWHVGSSQTRGLTQLSCTGSWILYH